MEESLHQINNETRRKRAKENFLQELSRCGLVTAAASKTGFCRTWFYHEYNRDKEFADAWEVAKTQGFSLYYEKLCQLALDGNVAALIYLMKKMPRAFDENGVQQEGVQPAIVIGRETKQHIDVIKKESKSDVQQEAVEIETVAWQAQEGGQVAFLTCTAREVLLTGNRRRREDRGATDIVFDG